MSTDRDVTRIVRSWLEEGATRLPDRVLDNVLDRLHTTPQRRAWGPAWRLREMSNPIRIAIAAAAVVVVVAVVGINVLPGTLGFGQPGPTASPSPSPTTTPIPFQVTGDANLLPGTYVTANDFPVRMTFDVPEGWWQWEGRADVAGLLVDNGVGGSGWGLVFWIVGNVYADPCDPSSELDPPVGPSVDDLVIALSNLPGYRVANNVDVTIDGFQGKQIELTAPAYGDECSNHRTWTGANGFVRTMLPGEENHLRILDVDGVRLVVLTIEYAHTTEVEQSAGIPYDPQDHAADLPELRQIVDSIRITAQGTEP